MENFFDLDNPDVAFGGNNMTGFTIDTMLKQLESMARELPAFWTRENSPGFTINAPPNGPVNSKSDPDESRELKWDFTKLFVSKSQIAKISILKDVRGVIKPSRMTLLLGPPGCGKTTLMLALSGKLNQSLKVTGEISYNGHRLEEFVPQKTSTYISQHDLHIAEMTVRETLDFSACCQGVGSRAEIMMEVSRREKQAGILPDPDVDTYMKLPIENPAVACPVP
ncbi:pleiotropic drug resistance protein 3-like [Telopea speciosissima]|uniref:pleiotropic drug resistance protein 3-like n=1 Tax=Telopea speciosissima TaxID=54955 RepID=UPI001CC561E8|nr:pleiotropic drug resistance protein 3-like [Telopea speciosissima]